MFKVPQYEKANDVAGALCSTELNIMNPVFSHLQTVVRVQEAGGEALTVPAKEERELWGSFVSSKQ